MSGSTALWWMLIVLAGACLGFAIGVAYFAQLHRATASIMCGTAPWHAAAGAIVRLSAAALAFFLLANLDAGAVVGGLAGFTLARQWAISRAGREQ